MPSFVQKAAANTSDHLRPVTHGNMFVVSAHTADFAHCF